MSWFRPALIQEPATSEEKFSIPYLRSLHARLTENKVVTIQNQAMVIEALRVLSEMVIFGDNNYEILFDFFCEKNMLALFLEIMRPRGDKSSQLLGYQVPVPVLIQILQTMGILCQCVKNDTSLYYILSNNYINEFLRYPYDFDNDELLDQFVSFLKSLSLRMNEQTIQFFFIEQTNTLPLLNRAIELLRYREGMVRIAAQTSILNIYRVNDPKARAICLQEDVLHCLFSQIVIILEAHYSSAVMCCLEYSANLSHPSSKDRGENKACKRIEDQLHDILISLEDWFFYLQDVFGLKIQKLHTSFVQYLITNFIYPVLLDPFLRFVQDPRDEMQQSPSKLIKSAKDSEEMLIFSVCVSLFFINQILRVLPDPVIKRAVATALFHPFSRKCRKTLLATTPPLDPLSGGGTAAASSSSRADGSLPPVGMSGLDQSGECGDPLPPAPDDETGACQAENRNMYREGFFKILTTNFGSGIGNRLPLLATLVVQNVANTKFCQPGSVGSSSALGSSTGQAALLKEVLESLLVWPKSAAPEEQASSSGAGLFDVLTMISSLLPLNPGEACQHGDEELPEAHTLEMGQRITSRPGEQATGGEDCSSPLASCLCSILVEQSKSTLTTLQAAANCLYGLVRATRCPRLHASPSAITTADDVPQNDRFFTSSTRYAVKLGSDAVLKRLQGSTGDIVISLLQEELRRPCGLKWSSVSLKLMQDSILLLPPVPSVTLRIGLEFGMPISQVEATRREVQTFLLLRSLFKQVHRLVSNHSAASSADDICLGMVDENIAKLSESGCVDEDYREFRSVMLTDRSVFPIVLSSSQSDPVSVLSTPEKPATAFWASSSPARDGAFSRTTSSLSGAGVIQGEVCVVIDSDEKWRENLHLVFDDYAFLIVSKDPGQNACGTIRLVAPIHQTDVSISTEKKNILKVLIRSADALPLTERIGAASEGPVGSPEKGSSFSAAQPNRGISLLQPRQPNILWRVSIWFETERDCEMASQHIELRRIQVRHEKLRRLKTLLECWSDVSIFNPDDDMI